MSHVTPNPICSLKVYQALPAPKKSDNSMVLKKPSFKKASKIAKTFSGKTRKNPAMPTTTAPRNVVKKGKPKIGLAPTKTVKRKSSISQPKKAKLKTAKAFYWTGSTMRKTPLPAMAKTPALAKKKTHGPDLHALKTTPKVAVKTPMVLPTTGKTFKVKGWIFTCIVRLGYNIKRILVRTIILLLQDHKAFLRNFKGWCKLSVN